MYPLPYSSHMTSYVPPFPPLAFAFPSLLSPFPLANNSICICNTLSFFLFPPLSISLQVEGDTALMVASMYGHPEAIKLLLAAPDINVNRLNVSLYPLTQSHLVLGGRREAHLHPPPSLVPVLFVYSTHYLSFYPLLLFPYRRRALRP